MNRLREFRELKGLRQADLAEMVGVTQSYLSRIENDQAKAGEVSLKLMRKIAEALDIPPSELLSSSLSADDFIDVIGLARPGFWGKQPFWQKEMHYTTNTEGDARFPGIKRFSVVINESDGAPPDSMAFLVPIEFIKRPLEVGREYLVQRLNDLGLYELTIRLLKCAKDDTLWLYLADYQRASNPEEGKPLPYSENDPSIQILARVSSVTHYK